MRNAIFTAGFLALCGGVGWATQPGWGLALGGLVVCAALAGMRILGLDREENA